MTVKTLQDKIALVTGGSRNIGRETALALAAKGAHVIITYNEQHDLAAQTVRDLEALGVNAKAIQANLTGTANLERLGTELNVTLAAWGRESFDILVNNAGTLRLGMLDKISEADLDEIGRAHV